MKEIRSIVNENNKGELILSMVGIYEEREVKIICKDKNLAKKTLLQKPKLARSILRDSGVDSMVKTVELTIKKFGTDYKFIS